MKITVVGSGAREAAIVEKLYQDLKLQSAGNFQIFALPGNPGMEKHATCVPDIKVDDIGTIVDFASKKDIDLVVVGPEGPLGAGLVDALEQVGIPAFGPTQKQAQLEMSKVVMREIAEEFGIPIAPGHICENLSEALAILTEMSLPVVVKPDGPTAGKGVKICHTLEEAANHIKAVMKENIYASTGDTGKRIILEEKLEGREASFTIVVCGNKYVELATSEDHKQRFDGDQGDMTGGMGAYSPSPLADAWHDVIIKTIVEPLIRGINKRFGNYQGVLYIALMITKDGPKVLEVNCRLGDPETQVILYRLKTPLLPLLYDVARGHIRDDYHMEWMSDFSLGLTLVSKGYPGDYTKGQIITGIERVENCPESTPESPIIVYQAGTAMKNGQLVVNGGRVMTVVGLGEDLTQANLKTRSAANRMWFNEMDHRNDVGLRPNNPELMPQK